MKISKTIPIPKESRGAPRKYDFSKLEIGHSFPITSKEKMSVYSCLNWYNKKNGKTLKIKTGKDKTGELRCWRVE